MRLMVVLAVLATLGAACAQGPSLSGLEADPTTTTTTLAATTTTTAPPPSTSASPAEIDPQSFGTVDGTIAALGDGAVLRSGTATVELPTGDAPAQPTWSRDGTRLALVSFVDRLAAVTVVDGATGDVIAESAATRPYFFFSWSHDGSRIAALGPGDGATVLDILDGDGALLHREVATAQSLFVGWDPDENRLAAHADDRLVRVDADGTATDLGTVGTDFYAPKWIPGSREMLLVVDLEGTSTLVRRGLDDGASMTTLGPVEREISISVDPAGTRAAISMIFEQGGASGARGVSTADVTPALLPQTLLPQSTAPQTGTLEIVDLITAERTLIHEGVVLWAEWSPDGSTLLYSVHDGENSDGAAEWWGYTDELTYPIVAFVPSTAFYQTHMVFADQYIEQPRLWSPTGDAFVYPEETPAGPLVWTAPVEPSAIPTLVAEGGLASWSRARTAG